MYQTWEEHYRIAEKLYSDAEYVRAKLNGSGLSDLMAQAQFHATMASVRATQRDVDTWQREAKATFDSLPKVKLTYATGGIVGPINANATTSGGRI